MAKPDPKRCPQLKIRVWGKEGFPKPALPLLPAQRITIAFSQRGRRRVGLVRSVMVSPWSPHLSREGQDSKPWVEGWEGPVGELPLHANHWACRCLTTFSRIGGLILGTATGLGACVVAPMSPFPFPCLGEAVRGGEGAFLPAPPESRRVFAVHHSGEGVGCLPVHQCKEVEGPR